MCGIFGTINVNPIDEKKFDRSVELLRHRGPDDKGIRVWGDVAFGFMRLAIQDLSDAGRQPMSHSQKPIHIIFNGEIYNYKILRDELRRDGAQFFSTSDTEVILHSYERFGLEETLNKLEGMFGFALYDERSNVVYLARDRFGQKPLFYAQDNKAGFIFSSEIKSILKYRGGARLNFQDSLNPLFTTGLSPRGRTMFDGVSQLEEGSYIKYDLNAQRYEIKRYFSIFDWVSESRYKEISGYSKEKLLDVYEHAFQESVDKHLLSDAPLASLFSAGLDSSLITAFAAKRRNIDLYYFESELQNYLKYPKFFASRYKQSLKIAKGDDQNFIFKLPQMIYHYETINKEEGPVLANLCRLARGDGIKAFLTGDTSDELFGGYPSHQDFLIRSAYYQSKVFSKVLKGMNRFFPNSPLKMRENDPLGIDYVMFPSGENFHEVPLNCIYHRGERLDEWKKCLGAYDFIKNKKEQHMQAYLLDDVHYRFQRFMIRADRFGMMESVELRLPFLDPEIVKLAVNTPLKWKMRKKPLGMGYEGKYIIKELAVRLGMPKWYVYRKKIGTPHNSTPQVVKLLQQWSLKNLSDFLNIEEKRLKKIALESFDLQISRQQYAFLAMEVLIRLFVNGQKCAEIEEEFKSILLK